MDYTIKIQEDIETLLREEKRQKKALERDRIRFLRLLKTGECTSQQSAGAAIGLSERQSQRLWRKYREAGLEGLLSPYEVRYWGKLSSYQISQLRAYLTNDQAQTLSDIQAYLAGSLGVNYTIGGVSDLCKRLKIKRKRGRPVNIRQKPGDVEAFKKTLQP